MRRLYRLAKVLAMPDGRGRPRACPDGNVGAGPRARPDGNVGADLCVRPIMQAPIYGRAHTQVRPYRNRATTGGCPYMSSGAGGQGDAFHPGQRGSDGPDEHLGFHEHGNPRRIVRDPHPDIALVPDDTFERHDSEDADGVKLAEWAFDPFRPLDLQLKPVVLLVVVDIDDR